MNKNFWSFIGVVVFIFLIIGFCFNSCRPYQSNEDHYKGTTIVEIEDTPLGLSIQTVNGCQYVYAETQKGVAIIHAANCNNPYHND